MDQNKKILILFVSVLVIIGVFILFQPSDFVKMMTEIEKTESKTLNNLATAVKLHPYDSITESERNNYIQSLDPLYNSTYNFKKSLETYNYPPKYKEYVNAQLAYLDLILLSINNSKSYYTTGNEFYADMIVSTNKTVRAPHISDIK